MGEKREFHNRAELRSCSAVRAPRESECVRGKTQPHMTKSK